MDHWGLFFGRLNHHVASDGFAIEVSVDSRETDRRIEIRNAIRIQTCSAIGLGELSLNLNLTNKVAVVTGGANGIGAATVALLRDEGCRTFALDLAFKDSLDSNDIHSDQLVVDVTNIDQLELTWKHIEKTAGPIDVLVHAAAIGSRHFGFPYTNVPLEAWDRVLKVNILGMTNVAHIAGPAMAARRSGAMVFLASVAGQMGSQTDPPYSASKAANINFAQCMAKDLARHSVRVNTVCPGMVQTTLNESVWQSWNEQQPEKLKLGYDDWAAEKISRVIPLGRWQKAEDVAAMIVFLCSPRASEITGQTINVDGGCVMHS